MELFENKIIEGSHSHQPLAERMRPNTLDDFVGQKHLVGAGKPLRLMIESSDMESMIFWGPPGVGKTTLALIIANSVKADFIQISAVSAGVKDVRKAIDKAEYNLNKLGKKNHFIH